MADNTMIMNRAKHRQPFIKRRFRLFFGYLGYNVSSSMEYRTSFLVQTFGMFLNNASFALFWWILYEKVGTINGFSFRQVMTLWAFSSSAFGISVVLFGNLTRMVDIIMKGELDSYLLQPRDVLWNVSMSNSKISGWGDILYGYILFFLLFGLDIKAFLIYTFFVGIGMIVFVSVCVGFASLTFFVGSLKAVAVWALDFTINFTLYPESIYSGVIKVVLFTVIPSGLISMMPARLLHDFNPLHGLILVGGAILWLVIAKTLFALGLKKYESGNLMVQKL